MTHREAVSRLLFEYEGIDDPEIERLSRAIPPKLRRWLGAHHPDNSARKVFLRTSGVAIGDGTVVNGNFIVSDGYQPLLTIGERVAIGPNVTVICESGPNNSPVAEFPYVATH